MRVIKPGREPKKEIEQTCERCGCVFAYGEKDVKYDWDEAHYNQSFHFVICPTCGCKIEVESWSGY